MNNKELQVLIFDELDHVARHDLDLKQDYLKLVIKIGQKSL